MLSRCCRTCEGGQPDLTLARDRDRAVQRPHPRGPGLNQEQVEVGVAKASPGGEHGLCEKAESLETPWETHCTAGHPGGIEAGFCSSAGN